jgi:fused signal recognition particle receptor
MNPLVWGLVAVALAAVIVWLVLRSRSSSAASEHGSAGLGQPMAATRSRLASRLDSVLSRSAAWDELQDELIASDLGVGASARIVDAVRRSGTSDPAEARSVIRTEMVRILSGADRGLNLRGDPSIVVVVGVNGAGKTTTVAKLAARLSGEGRTPIIGAADTFRPAADTQLAVWAERAGAQVVSGQAGGDPAAVAYDALRAAKARRADVLVVDTAGRFETRHNLMQELAKIIRVLGRDGDEVAEVLLVMDATTGQGGLPQARRFAGMGVTGMILTKMDGTAKGGVILAIESELGLPVKFIGTGEGLDDLVEFDGSEFVDALLGPA